MNYLILGGNGYLGSKIAHDVSKQGNSVICVIRKGADLSRLKDIESKIEIVSTDLIDNVLKKNDIHFVINTVCNYSQNTMQYDGVLNANLIYPLQLLNKCIIYGICNYLTIDTGLPNDLNMYSMTKNVLNEFGKFYSEKHDLNFYSLQLEMFYGADEPENRFLPSIIRKMLRGEDVNTTLGTQKRDIIAVGDVIKAINIVLNCKLKGYQEIPVGTGVAPKISEIIDFIWKETDQKSVLNKGSVPMRANEPNCIADVRALETLGTWKPIDWKQGIKEMIIDIRKNYIKGAM